MEAQPKRKKIQQLICCLVCSVFGLKPYDLYGPAYSRMPCFFTINIFYGRAESYDAPIGVKPLVQASIPQLLNVKFLKRKTNQCRIKSNKINMLYNEIKHATESLILILGAIRGQIYI
jgi:hypothetical protein